MQQQSKLNENWQTFFNYFLYFFACCLISISLFYSAPLCCVGDDCLYSAINSELNTGASYVTGVATYPSWPSNQISEENISYPYLQQKYKWSGIGYHVLENSESESTSLKYDGTTINGSLVETDEWQQEGVKKSKAILAGLSSISADGWDSFLSTNAEAQDTVFLKKETGSNIAMQSGLDNAEKLIGQKVTFLNNIDGAEQTFELTVGGYFDILPAFSSYYRFLFGDCFFVSTTTVFQKIKGTRLIFQFDSTNAESEYRYNFFDYIKTTVLHKFEINYKLTPDESVRNKIEGINKQITNYPLYLRIVFGFLCAIECLLFPICAIPLIKRIHWRRVNAKKILHLAVFVFLLCPFSSFWIALLVCKGYSDISFVGLKIPLVSQTPLALEIVCLLLATFILLIINKSYSEFLKTNKRFPPLEN